MSETPASPPAPATAAGASAYGTLVRLFWTLSMREPPGYLARQSGGKTVRRSMGWWIYLLYGGLVVAGVMFASLRGMEGGTYAFYVNAGAFLLVGMAVAADFAGVIVAPGEDEILFHLPLKSRAYLAARATVAMLHTSVLAAAFALPPMAWGAHRYGLPFAAALGLGVLLTSWFALILAFVVYRVSMQLLGSRRLRDLLAWLPPLVGLTFAFLPQVLMRATGGLQRFELPAEVLLVLPPGWYAALPQALLGPPDDGAALRALVGVGALLASFALLVGGLGRGLLSDLQRLLASGEGSGPATSAERAGRLAPGPWSLRVLGLHDGDAQAGYLLAAGALRLREVRVRMASSLLTPFLMLLLVGTGDTEAWYTAFSALLLGMDAGTLLTLAVHHEHHAASWFYGALPVRRYGRFVAGVSAALTVRYILPAFVILVGLGLVLTRDPWAPAIMLFGFLAGLIGLPIVARGLRHPPLSQPLGPDSAKQLLLTLLLCLLVSIVVLAVGMVLAHISQVLLFCAVALLVILLRSLLASAVRFLDRWPPWARPGYGG